MGWLGGSSRGSRITPTKNQCASFDIAFVYIYIYTYINWQPDLIIGPHLILGPRLGPEPGGTRAGGDPGWDPGRMNPGPGVFQKSLSRLEALDAASNHASSPCNTLLAWLDNFPSYAGSCLPTCVYVGNCSLKLISSLTQPHWQYVYPL